MARFLSQEWLDELCRVDAAGTEVPGGPAAAAEGPAVSARIECTVTAGPDGDVTWRAVLDRGTVVEAALGADPTADLTLSAPYEVAVAVLTGDLDPAVAYMQGRLKAAGDTAALHALLAFAQSERGVAAITRLAAGTDL